MTPIVTHFFGPDAAEPGKRETATVERHLVLSAVFGMISALYGVFFDALVFRIIGALLLGFVVVARLMARRHATRAENARTQRWRYTITEEALIRETEDGVTSKTAWPLILDADESHGTYRLFAAEEQALSIPMDAFASDADRAQFESLLREKGLLPR